MWYPALMRPAFYSGRPGSKGDTVFAIAQFHLFPEGRRGRILSRGLFCVVPGGRSLWPATLFTVTPRGRRMAIAWEAAEFHVAPGSLPRENVFHPRAVHMYSGAERRW